MKKTLAVALATITLISLGVAQETRSMMLGRVLDPQGSAVAGAAVGIRNVDTGVAMTLKTNEQGYYEAPLLLPGNYELTAEAAGFKKLVRKGIILSVSSRLELNLPLELGTVTDTVTVAAETPLLETSAVSAGRVIDNRSVMELPVLGNSAILLVKIQPGVQTPGVNNYLALHSNVGGSDYSVNGNVGGNSWTLDGSPNQGPARRTAYLPYTDAVAEFKVETNNFDAAVGQTSGGAITMISKSGTNSLHGTATWQHWQQRWQGTPFFVKQAYYRSINAAEQAGNKTLADQIRNTDKQTTGRSNNWGASGGGPVVIPKLYNGRNKTFWFLTYNAFKDVKTEDPSTFNRTVPTQAMRDGNFSDLLSLPNPTRYQVYDPTTVARDPVRTSNFSRQPFAGNIIPRSRFVNPAYDAISKLYPLPNNPPAAGLEPVNNYLASKTPYNWDYKAYSNRVDHQISDHFRAFGRWSYNNFGPEDRSDWTYETARGLNQNGLVRNNKGGNIDVVWTQTPTTVWNFNAGINQFREGNIQPFALSKKPSDIGLPAYMDQKAGDQHILPQMAVSGYTTISPGGVSTWTRYRFATAAVSVSRVQGNHSIRAGFDNRYAFRTGGGGGNTSGNFTFSNQYMRRYDDDFQPSSNLGLGWAAFILGIPNSGYSIATNDSYAMITPYYALFVQDGWRISRNLTLNLGLRMEYEGGSTERYNRMIGDFDSNAALPIAAAAQAAYAANPIPELPASQFRVLGGSQYVGVGSRPRELYKGELMWLPRIGVAYSLNSKTVLKAGYGLYYDSINVLNFGPDQFGFSRNTSTVVTTDFGQTWGILPANANPGNFRSPLVDPFPVRSDGTRFDTPTRDALGNMARTGRGFTYTNYNQPHARQQRWRAGVQRQLAANVVVDVAYAGSYSDRVSIQAGTTFFDHRVDALPAQYWADGLTRNDAVANNLNANVTNPFRLANFAALQQSNPLVYADMATQGFFTSATIRRHQLLRPFPQANGLNIRAEGNGYTRTHEFQLNFEKRFSKGFLTNIGYTAMYIRDADFYWNEFDTKPTERFSNDGRPHRLVGSGVYELPFGKGRRFGSNASGVLNYLIGGWQTAATYELQPGSLIDFGGNVFYYGNDTSNIRNVNRTFETWFNTADFERSTARQPNAFHRRQFAPRVGGLRGDKQSWWNANIAKNIPFSETGVNLQLRLDVLNVQNRSQMANPNADPYSTNFGRITSQTSATNRWIQVQMRLTF